TLSSQDTRSHHTWNGSADMLDGLNRQSEIRQKVSDYVWVLRQIDVILEPRVNSLHAHLRTAR
ncbi:MAG: hypothetical protein ACKOI2_09070, partial [Actinomycetota bacterium]